MDIGTAKVSAADRRRAPHHGLDLVDPDEPFTAADYLRHATTALEGIAQRGGLAILVGGTGLYLRSVARGFALDETGRDPATRELLERRLVGEGLHSMVAQLRSAAPTLAGKTDLANPRRVVRALERATVHGDLLPPAPRGYPSRSVWIGLHVDSATHRGWITERARAQFAAGLLDEAASLRQRYDPSLRPFSAVGYHEAWDHLDGNATLDQAMERNITRNWQFARRQKTWFRAEPDVEWLDATDDPLSATLRVVDRMQRG